MTQPGITTLPTARVTVAHGSVTVADLVIDDPVLADFVEAYPPERRAVEVANLLSVGVRGITAMGVGATVKGVGEEVERLLSSAAASHNELLAHSLASGRRSLESTLDPEVRSSLTARALREIEARHNDLLAHLDLDRTDSHTARLMSDLTALLGPEGPLRERLSETFDPGSDGSAMSRLLDSVDRRFTELRDLIVGAEHRAEEAARGTAKGRDYEREVVDALRRAAAEIGGCAVEATGLVAGGLEAGAKVGDAVLTLPDGTRVAVEAKNTSRIILAGKDGILDELDRAMTNRSASWAVCVAHHDAYPLEVGAFAIYGNRVLLVDDGEGVLLRVALRWIGAAAASAKAASGRVDVEAMRATIDRLRTLAQRFTGTKRALAGVRTSVDQVRGELDGLRTDLLDLVDDLACSLSPGTADTQLR